MFVFEMVTLGSGTVTQGSNPVPPEPASCPAGVRSWSVCPGPTPRAQSPSSSAVAPVVSESVAQLAWAGAIRGCGIPAPSSRVSTHHLITRILKLVVRTRSCTGHGYRCRRWRRCWRRSGYLRFKLHPCVHPSRHCDLQQLP